MKRIITVLLCFFLSACDRSVLFQENSGMALKLLQGAEFKINLPENATTGYTWEFLTDPKKSDVVQEIDSEYIAKKSALSGGGGRRIITYQAAEKGTVELRGFYKRGYENILMLDAMDGPRVRYTIIVE